MANSRFPFANRLLPWSVVIGVLLLYWLGVNLMM